MFMFTYESDFGTYKNCFFKKYGNTNSNNFRLDIWSMDVGPVCTVTVPTDYYTPEQTMWVKDYSENAGMWDWLVSNGFIHQNPLAYTNSGFVRIKLAGMTHKLLNTIRES